MLLRTEYYPTITKLWTSTNVLCSLGPGISQLNTSPVTPLLTNLMQILAGNGMKQIFLGQISDRSSVQIKTHTCHASWICSKYFKNILVRKYFVIIIVDYSHDHISDKGCSVHYVDVPISGWLHRSELNKQSINNSSILW